MDAEGEGVVQKTLSFPGIKENTKWLVLDTNYLQYAVVYGCDEWLFGMFSTRQAYAYSRNQTLDATVVRPKIIKALQAKLGVDYDIAAQMTETKQTACSYPFS